MKQNKTFLRKKSWIRFVVFFLMAVLLICFALFAGFFAPYDPLETDYAHMLEPPSRTHLFGTDQLGRDLFSRILHGGKNSLLIAFAVTAIVSVTGILIGTAAGFMGGFFDGLLMRISDMLMAFPGYIFTIAIVSFIGVGTSNLILAMSVTGWTFYARISRSLVLSIKNNVYIEQARLGGASNWRILFYYIVPNVLPSLLVNISQDRKQASDDFGLVSFRTGFSAASPGMGVYAVRREELHVFGTMDAVISRNDHFTYGYYL